MAGLEKDMLSQMVHTTKDENGGDVRNEHDVGVLIGEGF